MVTDWKVTILSIQVSEVAERNDTLLNHSPATRELY